MNKDSAHQHLLTARALHAAARDRGEQVYETLDWSSLVAGTRVAAGLDGFDSAKVCAPPRCLCFFLTPILLSACEGRSSPSRLDFDEIVPSKSLQWTFPRMQLVCNPISPLSEDCLSFVRSKKLSRLYTYRVAPLLVHHPRVTVGIR